MTFWTSRPAAFLRKAWGALSDWNELATDVIGAALHRFVRRWGLLAATAALIALGVGAAGGRGILIQAIFHNTATGGADRTAYSKLADFVSVKDFGALCDGATDDSAAFTAALTAAVRVYVPEGTCSLGTTGISFRSGTQLIGAGQQITVLTYSGTGCALTIDSVQGTGFQHLKVQLSGDSASAISACVKATTANVQRVFVEDVYLLNNGTARTAGQIGLLVDGSANGVYWSRFLGVFANKFDTNYKVTGDGSTQANSNSFDVVSAASNTPFNLSRGNDNQIRIRCTTSDGTLVAGTQTCITVGDGATVTAGNHIQVFSDQGATGKSFAILAAATNNWIFSDNESTTAGTDANATATATNFRFEMKPSAQPTMNFGNLTLTSSTTPTYSGSPSGAGNPLIIRGAVSNASTAVAVRISGNATLSTAGALIADFNNNGVKSSIDLNGAYSQGGVTLANIATGNTSNGTMLFCTNCDPASNPCTAVGAQTGSFALRMNGAWKCM